MSTNPLLNSLKLPGRVFQLPSKGIFYAPGILADTSEHAEVQVKPLSALAEIKLRSPDMLFSGRALAEVCQECIPEILQPYELLSKDIDAIFCFLRIVTYGAEMEIKSTHECAGAKLTTHVVDIEQIVMNANNLILDHALTLYTMTLSNEQKLMLKPVTFKSAMHVMQLRRDVEQIMSAGGTSQELIEKTIIQDMLSIIESVEGITDVSMIEEWLRQLPKKYYKEITSYSKSANEWGFNLTAQLTCKECGEVYPHNLELDPINFFTG
jgi:hypothetical protein